MISSLTPANQQFLDDLNRIGDRMQRAQRDISTGKRIHSVSDDPDQISTLLQARADLASSEAIGDNLGRVKIEVDTGEQALQSAVTILDRIRTLGSSGASTTNSADTRATIATEVESLYGQLVGLTRTSVEGRYIFSGDRDQTPPYSLDFTQANPLSSYAGSAATRQVQHPNGTTFPVALTADIIFDSADPATSVFKAVDALRNGLLADDDTAILAAVEGLSKPAVYLNRQLAVYGTTQNKIAEAKEFGARHDLQLKGQISGIEDTDLTDAILRLNQAQLNQQAALQAKAQMPRTSLFDFLR